MEQERQRKLNEVLDLALKLHGDAEGHRAFTFRSMLEHVNEVHDLWDGGDDHWKAETVDILIHCLLLLRNGNVSAEEIVDLIDGRLDRFREKILDAIRGQVEQ